MCVGAGQPVEVGVDVESVELLPGKAVPDADGSGGVGVVTGTAEIVVPSCERRTDILERPSA
jgi:hypothetical protein